MFVAEIAVGYQNYVREQEDRKAGITPPTPALTQEQMKAMIERVKK
jgi:hypothetical protein